MSSGTANDLEAIVAYIEVSSYDLWRWSSEVGTIFAILSVQNIPEGILEEADLLA